MPTGSNKKSPSMLGRIYVIVCLLILASLASGWLLTGELMRVHEAALLSYRYALRGAGPTWQRIMCIKAWDKSADRTSCGERAAVGLAQ